MNGLDVRLQGGFCGEGFAARRRGWGVVPLADGDGEIGVGLGGGGEEGGVGGGVGRRVGGGGGGGWFGGKGERVL